MYLFLAVLGLCCCLGFSLVTVNGGYSLVVVRGCLISVASTLAGRFFTTKPPGKPPLRVILNAVLDVISFHL